MQTFVEREVARTSRNLLLGTLVLVAVLVAGGALSAGYYANYFGGPYPSTLEEIARASGKPGRYHVKLQGELAETGYQFLEKTVDKHSHAEKSRKIKADYLALSDGERSLLVKAPVGASGTEITGWLGGPESVDREVLAAVRKDAPELAGTWLPVVLDATQDRTFGTVGLVAAALLLLLVLRNLRAWTSRRARPDTHPIWKRLAELGDPRSRASQLDLEMRGGDVQSFKGGATVSASWLVVRKTYGLGLLPLDRLAWIYKKVTRQKQFFITVSKTFEAAVKDRDGGQLSVRASEAEVDGLLGALARRAPWAIAGYDEKLEQAWNKRRAEVVAAVDARRQQPRAGQG